MSSRPTSRQCGGNSDFAVLREPPVSLHLVAITPALRYSNRAVCEQFACSDHQGACCHGRLSAYQVSQISGSAGNVALVRFSDRRIIDAANIQELGEELFGLVEKEGAKALVLELRHRRFPLQRRA